MGDVPIFNKISDAISFIVQARAEEIERTCSPLYRESEEPMKTRAVIMSIIECYYRNNPCLVPKV